MFQVIRVSVLMGVMLMAPWSGAVEMGGLNPGALSKTICRCPSRNPALLSRQSCFDGSGSLVRLIGKFLQNLDRTTNSQELFP